MIDARFPGRVGFKLDAAGRGFDRSAEMEVRLRQLDGHLRNRALAGHAHLRLVDETLKVDDADLSFGTAYLQAHGDYGARASLSWNLNVPDFAQLLPDTQGSLKSRGDTERHARRAASERHSERAKFEYGDYQRRAPGGTRQGGSRRS